MLLFIDVAGVINANEVWDDTSQPYRLVGDLTIPGGVTLTIQPGVQVLNDNQFNDVFVEGILSATGVSFPGTKTDIRVQNGGRLDLSNSSVAGELVEYQIGSLGTVTNTQFTTRLDVFSTSVSVGSSFFSLPTPIRTHPSLVDEFYDNAFATAATIDVQGPATENVTWQVISNLARYHLSGDVIINDDVTLTIQPGTAIASKSSRSIAMDLNSTRALL